MPRLRPAPSRSPVASLKGDSIRGNEKFEMDWARFKVRPGRQANQALQ